MLTRAGTKYLRKLRFLQKEQTAVELIIRRRFVELEMAHGMSNVAYIEKRKVSAVFDEENAAGRDPKG